MEALPRNSAFSLHPVITVHTQFALSGSKDQLSLGLSTNSVTLGTMMLTGTDKTVRVRAGSRGRLGRRESRRGGHRNPARGAAINYDAVK